MTNLRLLCFARGRPGAWEAICVDLDIAVQAETQKEAFLLLETSILEYLSSLADESPEDRARLLKRRTPLYIRIGLALGFMWHTLRSRKGDYRATFDLPCPA